MVWLSELGKPPLKLWLGLWDDWRLWTREGRPILLDPGCVFIRGKLGKQQLLIQPRELCVAWLGAAACVSFLPLHCVVSLLSCKTVACFPWAGVWVSFVYCRPVHFRLQQIMHLGGIFWFSPLGFCIFYAYYTQSKRYLLVLSFFPVAGSLCCLAAWRHIWHQVYKGRDDTFCIWGLCGSKMALWSLSRVLCGFFSACCWCDQRLSQHEAAFPHCTSAVCLLSLCFLLHPAPLVISYFSHSKLKSVLLLNTTPFKATCSGTGFEATALLLAVSPVCLGLLSCHIHTFPLSCTCRSWLASGTEFSLQT